MKRRAFAKIYRLSVFPIVIPPLRDRPNDIRAFAEYFANRAANRFGLWTVPVSDEDVRLLADYRWPGNVREMAAVMDRAVLIGQGRTLNVAAALGQGVLVAPVAARSQETNAAASTIASLDDVIRRHIESTLQHTRGPASRRPARGSAPAPHGKPATLRARMRKLHVNWRAFRT